MLHGRETTLAFMNRVTASLEAKNLIPTENEIVFLGRPADNPLFKKDELWDLSNDRARYGDLKAGPCRFIPRKAFARSLTGIWS